MNTEEKALLEFFRPMVNDDRMRLLEKIISLRTRYFTVVLEDIFQPNNASAVLRTCDCFGIQDVHIIENRNEYTINPEVELGSAQWLTIRKYNQGKNNTLAAIEALKSEGYRIVATTPHKNDVSIADFDPGKGKAALLFGTELKGLSKQAIGLSDEFLHIPMLGFTESLNISVSVAIILQNLRMRLIHSDIDWSLMEQEKESIRLQWFRNSIRNAALIEREFKKRVP